MTLFETVENDRATHTTSGRFTPLLMGFVTEQMNSNIVSRSGKDTSRFDTARPRTHPLALSGYTLRLVENSCPIPMANPERR